MTRSRIRIPVFALFVGAVCLDQAAAQDPHPLVTDRPDFTESAVIVPEASVQLETGISLYRAGGSWSGSGPEALVRWAPGTAVELRLSVPNWVASDAVDGLTDMGVGVKVPLGTLNDWSMATVANLTLPTGRNRLTANRAVPSVIVVGGRSLSSLWSLGSQVGIAWPNALDDPLLHATLVVGRGLGDGIGTFAELLLSGRDGDPLTAILHHGYVLAVGPLSQVDFHVGLGLTDVSTDVLIGGGWSHRF